jgi:hypothetical protein
VSRKFYINGGKSMKSQILGSAFFVLSVALLGWLLYDATNVQTALGLENIVSEAVVVIVGLFTVAALFVASIISFRVPKKTA